MAITKFTPDFIRTNPDLISKVIGVFDQFEPIIETNSAAQFKNFVFYRINHPGIPKEDVEIILTFQYGDIYSKNVQISWVLK